MSRSPIVRLAAAAAPAVVLTLAAHAAAPQPPAREAGDLWEVTSTMSMEGMNMAMPAQTQKVCAAREWNKPPMADDDRSKCETIDFKNTASKTSWKMRCAGPPPMTGEGEITRTAPDAYKGWMKMTSSEGVMTMTLAGRRLGDCDAGETKRQMAQTQAQAVAMQKTAADAQKQSCMASAEAMDLRLMKMQASYCTDPAFKAAFCKKLDAGEGFKALCERGDRDPENSFVAAAAYCGRDPEAIRKAACAEALRKEDLDLLGKCCPDETQVLALRECAGRKYSEMEGSKYKSFCVAYARDTMAGGANAPDAGKEPETPKSKTKKLLKGLLNR